MPDMALKAIKAALAAATPGPWHQYGHLEVIERMERAERKLAEARAKASRLSERNRTLEEALWAVEWVHLGYLGYNVYRCPWCGATLPERGEPKHRPDCQRQVALAGPEPGGD